MHEKIEKNIRAFRAIAQDTLKAQPQFSGNQINQVIAEAAERTGTEPHVQSRIFELQIEKQRIMGKLKQDLAQLDNPFYNPEIPSDAQRIEFQQGQLITHDAIGNAFPLTLGDLLYDGEWGIKYACDPESVPRNIQKRFLIEDAKRRIRKILDQQIVKDALASTQVPDERKESYVWFSENAKREHEPGWIAERMVENVVRKACVNQGYDIHLTPATAFEDVMEKIDFIADRKTHAAGVDVESEESGTERVGIQFTISQKAYGKTAKIEKAKQVYKDLLEKRKISDIILVKLQIKGAQQKYLDWKHAGMPPGGPEKLLSPLVRRKILKYIMSPLYEAQEIEDLLNLSGPPANDTYPIEPANDTTAL